MDEIGQEPRRYVSLPPGPRRWLTIAGIAGLVAAIGIFGVTRLGGGKGAAEPGIRTASSAPAPLPARIQTQLPPQSAASGTVLLTCDSVVWKNLPGWQAGSVRVGPLWIVRSRQAQYARVGRYPSARANGGQVTATREVKMLVHVDAGPMVVMRAPAGSSPYFEFLNSPATTGDYQGLDGGAGYTFVPCPAGSPGHPGETGFYDVGFSIAAGRAASVEVVTPSSAQPAWLTFSVPGPR